jgi:two-component system chemotaxis response regulator CheB
VRVALLDDPAAPGPALAEALAADPRLLVVAKGRCGDDALALVRAHHPDVLLLRATAGGSHLDAIRSVMTQRPVPVIVCAPHADVERAKALQAGAVACVDAPPDALNVAAAAQLRDTVRLMAEVKVVRRWATSRPEPPPRPPASGAVRRAGRPCVVGIGTSTGGPATLRAILGHLPAPFPLPLLVVQHIAAGFLPGMAVWLGDACGLPVHVAQYGVQPLPGHVYLAPDGMQMGVGSDGRIVLAREASPTALCPSVSHLFHSLAEVWGPRAIGVLLTGMGKDGAEGLKRMRDCGAVTIAQDRGSSVVHGMPGEAIALGAATHVVPLEQIAPLLGRLAAGAALANHEEQGGPP